MIENTVKLDPMQVRQVRRGYRQVGELLPKAVNMAVPAAGRKTRVQVVRGIAENVNVKQGKLYQRGNRRRPVSDRVFTVAGMRGYRLTIDKGRIALGRFDAKQHWKSGAGGGRVRTRVSYRIRAGGGRERLTDAFVIEFSSGYRGVFRREGRSRLPLRELYGPSIPEVAEKDAAVRSELDEKAGERLLEEVESRLDFLLSRI